MEKKKAFQRHKSSNSHVEAVARHVTAPATVIGDIGDLLSERHALLEKMFLILLHRLLLQLCADYLRNYAHIVGGSS